MVSELSEWLRLQYTLEHERRWGVYMRRWPGQLDDMAARSMLWRYWDLRLKLRQAARSAIAMVVPRLLRRLALPYADRPSFREDWR